MKDTFAVLPNNEVYLTCYFLPLYVKFNLETSGAWLIDIFCRLNLSVSESGSP